MLLRRVTLFLFGATIASAQFSSGPLELAMMPSGCPPASELAPMICKLMQQNLAFQYKPQLITPSTYIPPLVLEKCDTPKLEQEIELIMPVEEKKPIVIPEAPVLPPITLPKFPLPVMFEEPILSTAIEPCEPASVPEVPAISIPVAPELPELNQIVEVTEIKEPVISPQPPEQPAFVMPELPVHMAESLIIVEPRPEEQPMHVPVSEYIEPLVAKPVAPELSLLEMPVFPEIVELPKVDFKPMEIPQPPELPAFVMPESPVRMAEPPMAVEPCPEEQPMHVLIPEYIEPLAAIPEVPELPLLELPVFPEIVELPKVDFKPMEILQPPVLPAFVMPELPVRMAEPPMHVPVPEYIESLTTIPAAPELPLHDLPVFPEIEELPNVDFKPVEIPQPPQLPAFVMPELPLPVHEQPIVVEPCSENELTRVVSGPEFIQPLAPIPAAPGLPPNILPELRVHVDLPTQSIIPKMIAKEPFATEEVILTQAEPVYMPESPRVPEFMMPEPMHMEIRKPTLPAHHEAAIIADPCEPRSHPTIQMSDFAPYFVRNTPYVFGKGMVLPLPFEYMHRF